MLQLNKSNFLNLGFYQRNYFYNAYFGLPRAAELQCLWSSMCELESFSTVAVSGINFLPLGYDFWIISALVRLPSSTFPIRHRLLSIYLSELM